MWHIRFIYPPGMRGDGPKRIEFSLRTPDLREAAAIAGPHIAEHKRSLLLNSILRGPQRSYVGRRFEPGRMHTLEDGTRVVASSDTLTFLDADDKFLRQEPNVETERVAFQMSADQRRAVREEAGLPAMPMAPKKPLDKDLHMLEEYLGLKERNKYYAKEARHTWEDFKRFVGGKTMAECTRQDGRAYVQHLRQTRKVKTATIVKLINYLSAPLNHASEHGGIKTNPFYNVIDQVKDAKKRLPLSEADMALCRTVMLPKLRKDEKRLWMMCATTGMRHSECFAATEEFEENGIRYIMIGEKTETSYRRVPIPDALAPYLPERIDGPLFEYGVKNVSKNLLRALRRAGITDPRKVVYSLRHRAHDRLRAAGCPLDIQHEIVGHETKTAHAGYGHGYPVAVLKEWVEKIGH